jgi:MFS family permease
MVDLVLISINLIFFLACVTYSILAPFYPIIAKEKGFGETFIGVIIGLYPLVGIVTTTLLARAIIRFGRKQIMFVGGLIEVAALVLFAFTIYLDGWAFVVASVLGRMFMGVGGSVLLTASLACITAFYPDDNLEAKIGFNELCGAIGILLGPVIGSGIYSFAGYSGTFLIFAGILLAAIVWLHFFLKEKANNEYEEKRVPVSLCQLSMRPVILTVLVVIIFGLSGPVYIEAVGAVYL